MSELHSFLRFLLLDFVFENSKQNPPTNRFIDGFCVLSFTNGIVNCVLLQQDANHATFALVDDTSQSLAKFLLCVGGYGLQFIVDSVRDERRERPSENVGVHNRLLVAFKVLKHTFDHIFALLLASDDGAYLGFDVHFHYVK